MWGFGVFRLARLRLRASGHRGFSTLGVWGGWGEDALQCLRKGLTYKLV